MTFSPSRTTWSSRILATVAAAMLAVACGGQSLEEARKAVIVDAEGSQLTGAMLEQYLLRLPEAPTEVTANMVVSAWIDVALLQHAARNNINLLDSAIADQAIRPEAVRMFLDELARNRFAADPDPTDAQADSLFALGHVRVFQQILLPVDVRAQPDSAKRLSALLQGLKARALGGESFDSLVKENSRDSVFGAVNGYMPAITADQLRQGARPVFDRTWGLNPNEVSDVVASPQGVHILRRVSVIEARPRIKEWLKPYLAQQANLRLLDSLSRARHVAVTDAAVERLRVFAADPMKDSGGDGPFVRWDGDSLVPAVVRLWLAFVPPRDRVQFAGAADTTLSRWLLEVGRLEMLARSTSTTGIPSAEMRATVLPAYRDATARVSTAWHLLGNGKQPTTATTAVLDTLVTGKLPYRAPPIGLGGWLRGRFNVTVDHEVMEPLIEEAMLERARRDAANPPAAAPKRDSTTLQ